MAVNMKGAFADKNKFTMILTVALFLAFLVLMAFKISIVASYVVLAIMFMVLVFGVSLYVFNEEEE